MPTRRADRPVLVLSLAALVAFAGHARGEDGSPASTCDVRDALASLGADGIRYEQHIVTLSNPFFEGRAPGTRGNLLAADYIETQFRRVGLTPLFPESEHAADGTEVLTPRSTFRQPFQMGYKTELVGSQAAYSASGQRTLLRPGEDYNVIGFSGAGEVTGPLAFVGYSIATGDKGYLGYPDDADLTGKVVMVLRFEPMDDEGDSLWSGQPGVWSWNAGLDAKINAAARRGAAGIILVNPPGANDPRADQLETIDSVSPSRGALEIPVVQMSTQAADALVRAADAEHRSLLDLRRLADAEGTILDLAQGQVTLRSDISRTDVYTDNVAGVLPGRGALADEYVVVGAHYDHVGYGLFGSRAGAEGRGVIHPGADDNASGTAGMLLAAEKLASAYAELPEGQDARSIIFMGFTAEESGLNGSRYFIDHPPIDLTKVQLMVNMDMIGRYNESLEIGGVGSATGLADWLTTYSQQSGLEVNPTPSGMGPSDHANFFQAGIPVLFFFTGLHDQYHMPSDTQDLINRHGAVMVTDLACDVTLAAATRTERFAYEKGNTRGGQMNTMRGVKVRFGISPGNYSDNKAGILVGDVSDGTTASEAGLRKGDRLIKWNGEEIGDVESWMAMLSKHEPGDEVEITYVRGDETLTTKAKLKARSRGG
ncbi:MAG: M20/M25/M40 family metallo-hydrolase [Phycisphaerales bacterium]|jgi:hypothetical protein|nr:M20/M25/M40 family metallo-hydrolase [Phycisphaerales bacterium]